MGVSRRGAPGWASATRHACSGAAAPGGGASQSGSRPRTTGIVWKFHAGGGDEIDHSSVLAPHGFSPAGSPRRADTARFTKNRSTPIAMSAAPAEATAFAAVQATSAG